ncbi:hypothetical protein ULMS_07800 [Patiriisocius marinistellae]|uniref:Uncharacterized protein n=1 Tax=Patiriisocius marinistellae TaxID=2494560 RepID=A0A5J4FVW3_9FLAO|nr:DUF6252 family protein [Patiriisocius marinistellae]GEQ85272.1 hypothetical protein ULMS_07800 [Patiriisocius marinistellae]
MKITKLFSVLILGLLVTLAACGGDDDNNEEQQGQNSFMATLNGVDYIPQFVTSFKTVSLNNILITGDMGTGETMQLFLSGDVTPGTYEWSTITMAQYSTTGDFEDGGFANTGNVTVTAHNSSEKTISGTFNFTTIPSMSNQTVYTITEGEFSVTYTDI